MAIYHLHVSVCSGKKGQSAVASCAYQSGEKLRSEADEEIKQYTNSQRVERIVDSGRVLLPQHAPREFLNREKLWNSVEAVEGANGQYARKWDIALPRELSKKEMVLLIEEFCQRELVSRGMCVDYSIHDDGNGNPHVHLMTTTRPFLENGQWGKKSQSVTVKKNGKAICIGRDKNGRKRYKHKCVKTTDWDKIETLQAIRTAWAEMANHALEQAGCKERISEKSYEALGIDKVPTVHEGYAAQNIEKRVPGASVRVAQNNKIRDINAEYESLIAERKAAVDELAKVEEQAQRKPWLINANPKVEYEKPPTNIAYKGVAVVKKWQKKLNQLYLNAFKQAVDVDKLNNAMHQVIVDDEELSATYLIPIQSIDHEAETAETEHKTALQNADAEISEKQEALGEAEKTVKSAVSEYNAANEICNDFNDGSIVYRIKHMREFDKADKALPELKRAVTSAKEKRVEARSAVETAETAKKTLIKAYNESREARLKRRETAVERLNSKIDELGSAEAHKAVPALATLSNELAMLQNAYKQAEKIQSEREKQLQKLQRERDRQQREQDKQTIIAMATACANDPMQAYNYGNVIWRDAIAFINANSPLAKKDNLYADGLVEDMYREGGILQQLHAVANKNMTTGSFAKRR